jgi:hypothetical protein
LFHLGNRGDYRPTNNPARALHTLKTVLTVVWVLNIILSDVDDAMADRLRAALGAHSRNSDFNLTPS